MSAPDNPLNNHEEVEPYEESKNAATVRHQGREGEGLHFLQNLNCSWCEHGEQCWRSVFWKRSWQGILYCLWKWADVIKVNLNIGMNTVYSESLLTLYSMKLHGKRHFVAFITSSLPKVVIFWMEISIARQKMIDR